MALSTLPSLVTVNPLVAVPIMCMVIGPKIYYARTKIPESSTEQEEVDKQIEAIQSVQKEYPELGLQAVELDLSQFNDFRKKVLSENSFIQQVESKSIEFAGTTVGLANAPILICTLSAVAVAYCHSILKRFVQKRIKERKKYKKYAELASMIDHHLYRVSVPEVILVEDNDVIAHKKNTIYLNKENDVVLKTVDLLEDYQKNVDNQNSIIACKLKMNLMKSSKLSEEQIFQFVKNNPFLLDAYYANCLDKVTKVAEKFLDEAGPSSSNVNITEINEIEEELYESLGRVRKIQPELFYNNLNTFLATQTTLNPAEATAEATLNPAEATAEATLDHVDQAAANLAVTLNAVAIDAATLVESPSLKSIRKYPVAFSNLESNKEELNKALSIATSIATMDTLRRSLEVNVGSARNSVFTVSALQETSSSWNVLQELKDEVHHTRQRFASTELISLDEDTDLLSVNNNSTIFSELNKVKNEILEFQSKLNLISENLSSNSYNIEALANQFNTIQNQLNNQSYQIQNQFIEQSNEIRNQLFNELTSHANSIEIQLQHLNETFAKQSNEIKGTFNDEIKSQLTEQSNEIKAMLLEELNKKIADYESIFHQFQNNIYNVLNREGNEIRSQLDRNETHFQGLKNDIDTLRQETRRFVEQMNSLPETVKEIKTLQIQHYKHFEQTLQDLNKSMVIVKKAVFPNFLTRMKKKNF